jgi:LysR family carnitine catabolism transcriptional activator
MRELGAHCLTLNDSVERAIGVLTEPGNELSAAAQALFEILRAEDLQRQFDFPLTPALSPGRGGKGADRV